MCALLARTAFLFSGQPLPARAPRPNGNSSEDGLAFPGQTSQRASPPGGPPRPGGRSTLAIREWTSLPATPLESVIEHFGRPGKFLIGGIETALLTTGRPDQIRHMVLELANKMEDCPGFAISSCGGLHGNIPLRNLEAYFDARAEIGATPKDWRSCCHAG